MTAMHASCPNLAKTIRSKNAGVDKITFDVIFADRATYERVRAAACSRATAVCRIFGIDRIRITDCVEFDPALRDQVHDLPHAAERQPRRPRHLRQPAIWPAAWISKSRRKRIVGAR